VLGPLEARVGERLLPLGGPKQRAVLALLLLRRGEVVPLGRLVDELWGEEPPASAQHSVEAYASRLRTVLDRYGVRVERRGGGYALDLGDAGVDLCAVEMGLAEAEHALAEGRPADAAHSSADTLARWRGPPLVDVPLLQSGEAEVARIEELRLRAHELHADSLLELGRAAEAAAELGALVDEHPYRESLVARIMVALYRAGRRADALDVYERARRALDEDLGLQPSRRLQALAGEMVREAPHLEVPVAPPGRPSERRPRRALAVALVGAVAAAALAISAVELRGSHGAVSSSSAPHVALVVPRLLVAGREDPYVSPMVDGLRMAEQRFGIRAETLVGDELRPTAKTNTALARRIENGKFDLVVLGSSVGGEAIVKAVKRLPRTRFVFIDGYGHRTKLGGSPNAAVVRFSDEQAGYLVGYLSGLVERDRALAAHRRPIVSAVGGMKIPSVQALVRGFTRGARRADPSVTVLAGYSGDFVDRSPCAKLAATQIDAGSDIVFAPAGGCGLGALSTAGVRGALGVGADEDLSYLGSHILASTIKRYDRAILEAVSWYVNGTFPGGRDVTVGIDADAVGIAGINADVPATIRRRVAALENDLRREPRGRLP
jgi:basic membrane lipoprotein Med (substrate-binding protein (PBP1-ABC) superfamily)/DNA-binding SARP family transcriptional activator